MTSKTSNSMKKSVIAGAVVLSQLLCLTPAAVLAADNNVRLAGQAVITNVAGAGSMTAESRAAQVQQNLDNALVAATDKTPASVDITYVKGLPVVTLGGYQVITVDSASAKASGTTPAVLAQRWADALRNAMRDQHSINSYVAQLSGNYSSSAPPVSQAPPPQNEYFGSNGAPPQQYGAQANYNQGYNGPPQGGYQGQGGAPQYGAQVGYNPPPRGYNRGRVVYAPAGLIIPATLTPSICTQVAKPGDVIQANVSQAVILGDSQIPVGSLLLGQVTEAKNGRYLGLTGKLEVEFNRLRTPDGVETPIQAHIEGGIGKYGDKDGDGTMVGETWKTKAGQGAIRGAAGAGLGAALGTAVGAIAGGKRGAGRGAWSGTAIGGGLGVTQSLVARKGKDVVIPSGSAIKIQLDQPVSIAGGGQGPYVGAY